MPRARMRPSRAVAQAKRTMSWLAAAKLIDRYATKGAESAFFEARPPARVPRGLLLAGVAGLLGFALSGMRRRPLRH